MTTVSSKNGEITLPPINVVSEYVGHATIYLCNLFYSGNRTSTPKE